MSRDILIVGTGALATFFAARFTGARYHVVILGTSVEDLQALPEKRPGLVKTGGEGKISMEAHPHLRPLEEALRSARFDLEVVSDAQSLVWGKLVINAAINPLTALLRVPNGELLQRPAARELMHALAEETARVAL